MSTERIKQILRSETSKESTNTDNYIKFNIDGSERLLPPSVILKVVNDAEQFNLERQNTPYYRILGTINPTISNALFNLNNGSNSELYTWNGFNYKDPNTVNDYRFFDPYYPNVLSKYLKEKDGWFGYFDPDIAKAALCNFYDMEPKRERFSFIFDTFPFNGQPNTPTKNWELTITYPNGVDSGHTMVNNGLLILEAIPAVVGNRQMTAIGMPCFHNLKIGDVVKINGTTDYDGEHVVIRTGLDNGDLKPYYFVIDKSPTGSVGQNSRMKRTLSGFESTYYFRLFKKIKTRNSQIIEPDDYEVYNVAFSENGYYDNIQQFVFNEDIDVSDLVDNLGRPLSELYLTMIKTSSNNLFSQVKSGIETPFIPFLNTSNTNGYLLDIPVINKIHNGSSLPWPSHNQLESNISINQNEFYGDLVEYNEFEVKETVLANVAHRFNTFNRETSPSITYSVTSGVTQTTNLGPRQEGYYYKPHNLIQIRKFSTYIEQGDQNTVGIPDYSVNLGDGRYVWRDLLDIGFNESDDLPLDYPFLNGSHYMYNNYCFKLKRQDPFDNWDLYYSKFPADPTGERITIKFDSNSAEDVC
jgi:hypothetical protein